MARTIAVNLGDVEAYKDLDEGTYLCEIQKVVHQEPREEGKYPQLRVHYSVIDGDALGERTTQWVSLSPKAAFRLKKWFMHFGFEDLDNLEIDEDTDELLEPDLVGVRVVVEVKKDASAPGGFRSELISVEDDMSDRGGAPAPEPAPAAEAKPAARPTTSREAARSGAAPRRSLR